SSDPLGMRAVSSVGEFAVLSLQFLLSLYSGRQAAYTSQRSALGRVARDSCWYGVRMFAPTQWSAPVAPWAVINTHPHREKVALETPHGRESPAYCRMLRRGRSHARRVTSVLRPLFPGYLFVSTGINFGRWRPILSTYGVRSMVCNGQNISCIDHAFVA